MTESLLTWLLGGVCAVGSAVAAHLYARISGLSERLASIEVDGVRGAATLELNISRELGAIRETLACILSRLDHLESNGDRGSERHTHSS